MERFFNAEMSQNIPWIIRRFSLDLTLAKPYPNILLVFMLMGLCLSCDQSHPQIAPTSPNILLILTDDMGFGDVTSSGNLHIRTPNIDKLAENSVRFNHFYVSPVCAPTRASLLTGRYHQRTGVRSVTNGYETMAPDEITIAEILKDNGYRTAIFGKWHLGEYYPSVPNAQGFEEFLGFRTGHTNQYFDATLEHNGTPLKTQGHVTDVLTDQALNFMTNNGEEPFFCFLAYNAPHTPLQVDSSWFTPYINQGLSERNARIYGLIEHLDQGVGKILKTLKSSKLLEQTIVIFMSDNGPISGWQIPQSKMRYNAGLRDQKFTIYEGGIRTQCYWMWYNHWSGNVESNQIAAHIDVLPTLLDILNIEAPSSLKLDGISLRKIVEDHSVTNIDRSFYQKYALSNLRDPAPFPGGMIREGPWKMVNGTELYHVINDIGEEHNLAKEHPDVLSELNEAYERWYQDISNDRDLKRIEISVGHDQENPVYLQPHHGEGTGNIRFLGNRGLLGTRTGAHPTGVDGDWTGNWKAQGDAIHWNINLMTSGRYRFKILARDSANQQQVKLRLTVNTHHMEKSIAPELLSASWNEVALGTSNLESGSCSLKLTLEGDLDSNFEIRALVVERL